MAAAPRELGRTSPPTVRVVRVLEEMANHPEEALTLSQISRGSNLKDATCLGILMELTRAGYLVRDSETRTYTLGPELVSLGRAAMQAKPSLSLCVDVIHRLSTELGCECTVGTVVGEQIVVFDRATPRGISRLFRPGVRFPYWGLGGFLHTIWDSDEVAESWFESCPVAISAKRVTRGWKIIASCRERGYLVRTLSETDLAVSRLLSHTQAAVGSDELPDNFQRALSILTENELLHSELAKMKSCAVFMITAPAYNASAVPEYLLSATVNRSEMPVSEVYEVADRLMASAMSVTEAMGGVDPRQFLEIRRARWSRTERKQTSRRAG
jgi:hypothetical protein